jgi:hypothetical protein
MQFQTMNIDALKRTVDLMLGQQATEAVAVTYKAIEAAMQAAYNEGHLDGYELGKSYTKELAEIDAEEKVEKRIDAAFDNGFMMGQAQAEERYPDQHDAGVRDATVEANTAWANGYLEGINEGYDEGYLAGVQDARARPAIADETVEQIIAKKDQFAFNGEYDFDPSDYTPVQYDEDLVTDSGDEQYDFDYFN